MQSGSAQNAIRKRLECNQEATRMQSGSAQNALRKRPECNQKAIGVRSKGNQDADRAHGDLHVIGRDELLILALEGEAEHGTLPLMAHVGAQQHQLRVLVVAALAQHLRACSGRPSRRVVSGVRRGGTWRAEGVPAASTSEGCGRLWKAVEGCGRLWKAVEGCGGLWKAARAPPRRPSSQTCRRSACTAPPPLSPSCMTARTRSRPAGSSHAFISRGHQEVIRSGHQEVIRRSSGGHQGAPALQGERGEWGRRRARSHTAPTASPKTRGRRRSQPR